MHSMLVKDYMTRNVVTIKPDLDILAAVAMLSKHGVPGAPVVDTLGNLIGMVTEKECLEVVINAAYHNELGGRVDSVMHKDVVTTDAYANVADVAVIFFNSGFRGMPVIDDNRLVGMIDRSDILRALLKNLSYNTK